MTCDGDTLPEDDGTWANSDILVADDIAPDMPKNDGVPARVEPDQAQNVPHPTMWSDKPSGRPRQKNFRNPPRPPKTKLSWWSLGKPDSPHCRNISAADVPSLHGAGQSRRRENWPRRFLPTHDMPFGSRRPACCISFHLAKPGRVARGNRRDCACDPNPRIPTAHAAGAAMPPEPHIGKSATQPLLPAPFHGPESQRARKQAQRWGSRAAWPGRAWAREHGSTGWPVHVVLRPHAWAGGADHYAWSFGSGGRWDCLAL